MLLVVGCVIVVTTCVFVVGGFGRGGAAGPGYGGNSQPAGGAGGYGPPRGGYGAGGYGQR